MRWLSNKPKENKQEALWRGIVHKAQADGDHSLDDIAATRPTIPLYRKAWVGAAAAVLIAFSVSLWVYSTVWKDQVLKDMELKEVFADASSVSRLVLSNGDTILLDEHSAANSAISHLVDGSQALDFRKLEGDALMGEIQTLETGRGKQLSVTLSDGTQVWLNASSKIEFPAHFEGHLREVSVRGEAYFEVAHNKQKPFVVHTADQQVKVLGTHFNVRGYREEPFDAVTLLEGAVEVAGKDYKPVYLKPADQFVQQHGHSDPSVRVLSNPESVIAWKNGDFYFEDADAETIVKELERWYPVSIAITKQDSTKKISGRIKRTDSMKEVADMLRFFEIEIKVQKQ